MTAPARVAGPAGRTRTKAQPSQRTGTGKQSSQPDRTSGARGRTAAAERAYARRAHRTERATGTQPAPRAERKPRSASRVTFVVGVIVLLIGGVVATLWFSTQATADAYQLEQANDTTNQLQVQVGQLRQRVAQEDSPPSLAARARRLGMVPAGDPAHLVVGPNGRVTVIGTPSAVQPPPPPKPATTPQSPASATSGTTATSTTPATTTTSAGG